MTLSTCFCEASFNGATSSSTWKAQMGRKPAFVSSTLQWGHVVVDVEGAHQWARTHGLPASMGPRRRRRGRAAGMPHESAVLLMLQWGHVVVDVEGADGADGADGASAYASMGPRRRRRGRTLRLDNRSRW